MRRLVQVTTAALAAPMLGLLVAAGTASAAALPSNEAVAGAAMVVHAPTAPSTSGALASGGAQGGSAQGGTAGGTQGGGAQGGTAGGGQSGGGFVSGLLDALAKLLAGFGL